MSFLGLDIAASGVAADEAILNTAAENLANVQTPGYAQESVQLSPESQASSSGVGEGVLVGSVTQQSSSLYEAINLASQANLAGAQQGATIASAIETAFPEPGGNGLQAQLSTTWSDLSTLATNPSNSAAATSVVQDFAAVANMFNTTYSSLQATATQLGQNLLGAASNGGLLQQANQLISEIAKLNVQIVAGNAGGLDVNALSDQRRSDATQLAGVLGVRTTANQDGSIDVYSGGISLVNDGTTATLVASGAAATGNLQIETAAGDALSAGGRIGALLSGVNVTIPGYLGQLSGVSDSLASAVNALQSGGVSANGTPGPTSPAATGWAGPMLPSVFVNGGSSTTYVAGPTSAASIAVSPALLATPTLLATASGNSTAGQPTIDSTTAQQMAAVGFSTSGPDSLYDQLIGLVGAQSKAASSVATTASALASSATSNLSSVEGVSTNQEMVTMLSAQQAFQATAQVMNALDTAFNSLLAVTT